jgi:UDP-GlcNAc:undecaprenyl-phosphate/decaprenyl-phosphate GlcNAc-1-phosphate transferase
MFNITNLVIAFFISLLASFFLTYPIKKLAIKIGAVDVPNHRKIHRVVKPRLGGLSIYIATILGLLYLFPNDSVLLPIAIGSIIVVITGIVDDIYQIRPLIKLSGQLLAAIMLISAGLVIEKITLPFIGLVELGIFAIPITILWIVGVTNAINLIDGLDGLASGVSTIALTSILIMAFIDQRLLVVYICVVLIGSNLGFLYHNFYPAKIYMGDTGSNFLGYSIAVISMLGLFKNIALFSFIIPIVILAVPIFDTIYAIIRRIRNKENIMMADKKHIHYQLLEAGFSHRSTVLIIYGFSAVFGVLAILFSETSVTMSYIILFIMFLLIHVLAEIAGVVLNGKKPLIHLLSKLIRLQYNKEKIQQKTLR